MSLFLWPPLLSAPLLSMAAVVHRKPSPRARPRAPVGLEGPAVQEGRENPALNYSVNLFNVFDNILSSQWQIVRTNLPARLWVPSVPDRPDGRQIRHGL